MLKSRVGGSDLDLALRRLEEVSWGFDGARSSSPLSSAHFHPARFISQIPSILISRLSLPGDLVLDPFCGSGTTLTEAQRLGRNAFGCDINPVSVLVSKVKTMAIEPDWARDVLYGLRLAARGARPADLNSVPTTVQIEKWYEPHVAMGLAAMNADIERTKGEDARALKRFCHSSILLKVCRETRHWGYVCDNTEPQGSPGRSLLEALDRAVATVVDALASRGPLEACVELANAPAASIDDCLAEGSVDLVVSSPPYEGVVDYIKAQRLSLEWMGLDVEMLRQKETGARSKRRRVEATKEFGRELTESFSAVHRVLRPGGSCAIVFGVSPRRDFTFDDLKGLMSGIGFELRGEYARHVALQRRLMPSVLTERLFVFTKPLVE